MDLDLNLKKTGLVTIGEVEFIQELWRYKFSNRTYEIYKHNTNGNMGLEYEEAKKKIIRNIILATEAPVKKGLERKRCFYYGNLMIHINLIERRICYIKNYRNKDFNWNVDEEKKRVLNEIMGIQENKEGLFRDLYKTGENFSKALELDKLSKKELGKFICEAAHEKYIKEII